MLSSKLAPGARLAAAPRALRATGRRLLQRLPKPYDSIVAAVSIGVRRRYWRSRRPRQLQQYLGTHAIRKLQIGAGPAPLPGWLNSDFDPETHNAIFLDIREHFPMPDGSFDYIFAEHVLEHVQLKDGLRALTECYRILRPGGTIRLVTPDLEQLISIYTHRNDDWAQGYISFWVGKFGPFGRALTFPSMVANGWFREFGHQYIFDHETLRFALTRSGFTEITWCELGESTEPNLRGVEQHGMVFGSEEYNRLESMVVEARRPD